MLSQAWTTRPFFGLEFRSSGPVQVLKFEYHVRDDELVIIAVCDNAIM